MPGDPPAEPHLHYPKPCGHERISQECGSEKRGAAERHQAQAHHRHNANGKCPARNDGSPIQQEPNTEERRKVPGTIKSERQKAAYDNRRSKTKKEFTARPGKERRIARCALVAAAGAAMATA